VPSSAISTFYAKRSDDALKNALRGAELVKRLLAFSRKQPLQPRTVVVRETMAEIEPLLRRTLAAHVEITTNLDNGLWPVKIDPVQLENAILNLAINARDAMPDGGRLVIEASNFVLEDHFLSVYPDLSAGEYVVISVSDTGTGMPREILARVFEPFFTTKGVGAGSGLGLSMVYGTMKQSGGGVKIYSEPGHGTTVRLFLPRAVNASDVNHPPTTTVTPAAIGTERVLVVEDNEEIRKVAVSILKSLAYSVAEAENAEAALARLQRGEPFDLLFTDIVMPGTMTGIGLAQRVRQLYPHLPVLLTTGFSSKLASEAEIRELGTDIIMKPYRKTDLAKAIRKTLDRSPNWRKAS
jgi:CheY-like chemotaxis protein